MTPISALKAFSVSAAVTVFLTAGSAAAADPIRVGIVQSGSGAFAHEEAGLTDMLRMLISEQNAKGGLLGRQIDSVISDPKSVTADYADGARISRHPERLPSHPLRVRSPWSCKLSV